MLADTPSVVPFTFAIYDLSGIRLSPTWERFVHCCRRKAGDIRGESLDLNDLLEQAETFLDCVVHLENYTTYPNPVWSSGFYITHTIPEWGAEKNPAVLRATPSLSWRPLPRTPGRGSPVAALPGPA